MNAEPGSCLHKDLKDIVTTIRSMDIEILNVDPNPCGHEISQPKKEVVDTFTIGITTQDKDVIIVKNIDISLRNTLGHTLVATTTNG